MTQAPMTQESAHEVKRRHAGRLMKLPGVVGVGVEKDERGRFVLAVHLDPSQARAGTSIPKKIESVPVKLVRSGPFRKQGRAG